MGIANILVTAALVVPCSTQPAHQNWVIAYGRASLRFSITQLPSYPITQSAFTQLPDYPITRSPLTNSPTYQLTNFLQVPVQQSQPNQPDGLDDAESLLQKQQYAPAEERLLAITQKQPKNSQAWFDLGFAQSHLGKSSQAIAAYRKAVELNPKWFEANLNLGLGLAKSGNLAEAATWLRAATQSKPTTGGEHALSNAWFSLAQVLEQSSPQEAATAYQKAAELNPQNVEAFLGAGKLLQAGGDASGAERNYLKAAELGSNVGVGRLIDLYLKQNRPADAEIWLRKYLAANPQNTAAQAQMARILIAQGKTQEAIATLEPLRASPDPSAHRELASLYMDAKQYDAAATLLQELVQKNPADAQLHWNLGSALLHQHKYPEAEAELLQALKINSELYDAYWELAYAAQQNKHYELAIRALDARARHQPETAATYWIRAVSYDGLRAYKPAAENYKLFLANDGGKSPDDEFKARHRLKAIEPQR